MRFCGGYVFDDADGRGWAALKNRGETGVLLCLYAVVHSSGQKSEKKYML